MEVLAKRHLNFPCTLLPDTVGGHGAQSDAGLQFLDLGRHSQNYGHLS